MALNDVATRMTARVAPYLQAIVQARKAGLTWADIGRLLGIEKADALRQAVKQCKWVIEQQPLPEPETLKLAKPVAASTSRTAAPQTPPLPGQRPPVDASRLSDMDKIRAEFDK